MQRNRIVFYIQTAAYNCIFTLAFGTVFQTFLLENGIDSVKVSMCVTAFNVIQTAVTVLAGKLVERVRGVLRGLAICLLSYAAVFSAILFVCFGRGLHPDVKYAVLFAAGAVVQVFQGVFNVLSYKQPHHIMDIKDYGTVSGAAGFVGGIVLAGLSAAMTFAFANFEYFGVMKAIGVAGVVLSVLAGASLAFYKPVKVVSAGEAKKVNFLKYRPFTRLIVPNLTRGISTGIVSMIAVIGYRSGLLDSTGAALSVTLAQIATLIACLSYSLAAKKHKDGAVCLAASVGMIAAPLMTALGSFAAFAVFYFAVSLFNVYISYTIPVIIADHVDYDLMGRYTSLRMGITALGTTVGTFCVPFLLDHVGATLTLAVSAALMLPCGIGYFIYDVSEKRKKGESDEKQDT